MRASGKRRALWLKNARDPDNWFEIPEFGVLPEDVGWRGFALPIVWMMADTRPGGRPESVRAIVRAVRQLARQHFNSLSDLLAANLEFIDLVEAEDYDSLTDRHKVAFVYRSTIDALKRNADNREGNIAANAIASASATLIEWVIGGSIDAALRRSEQNRKNAQVPRTKRVDHDTIEHEFLRLRREGFTDREARGILVANGVGSQSTIYRITTKKCIQ